ncbi:MAG TPA: 50S ribosomal protein L3 [Nitrososphaeria archaeon]|nr:50S ribosomal protein L3 [Nitrososphaeria archaeon]
MGHRKQHTPRRGSLAFMPRSRAAGLLPRIRTWPELPEGEKPRLLGTIAYKAGMTHVIMIDDRQTVPNAGKPLFKAVTVLAIPPLYVLGMRLYGYRDGYQYVLGDVLNYSDGRVFGGKPKKYSSLEQSLKDLESVLGDAVRMSAIVYSIPKDVGLTQRRPFMMEVAVSGGNMKQRFDYLSALIGASVSAEDVVKPGTYMDVISVSKGKGFQGPVKRFGIKRKQHKSRKSVREPGTLGPWHPAAVMRTVPMAGQMGFHQRIEYNKRVIALADESERPVTPPGGFLHFGVIRGKYVMLAGSVPGPAKRPVILRYPLRQPSIRLGVPTITYIDSVQGGVKQ